MTNKYVDDLWIFFSKNACRILLIIPCCKLTKVMYETKYAIFCVIMLISSN